MDLETIEALYENVCIAAHRTALHVQEHLHSHEPISNILLSMCQRAQPEELGRIKKHYEMSEEEEVKLLDKPEQSVHPLLTEMI